VTYDLVLDGSPVPLVRARPDEARLASRAAALLQTARRMVLPPIHVGWFIRNGQADGFTERPTPGRPVAMRLRVGLPPARLVQVIVHELQHCVDMTDPVFRHLAPPSWSGARWTPRPRGRRASASSWN